MSWKESKVRLLQAPALNVQDRKPDIQDLFLLASQATALSDQSDSNNHASHHPQLPLHPVKVEPGGIVISQQQQHPAPDSAMMPPPPPPPPRPPASPSRVSSTSNEKSELINTAALAASGALGKSAAEKSFW